jgi:hypothetical protein
LIAPKTIPHAKEKADYLKKHQHWQCPMSGLTLHLTDLHHAGIHNSKVNRKKYPLFIHSLMNLKLINHKYHMENGSWGKISYLEADKRERFLERHPLIAKFVNMED